MLDSGYLLGPFRGVHDSRTVFFAYVSHRSTAARGLRYPQRFWSSGRTAASSIAIVSFSFFSVPFLMRRPNCGLDWASRVASTISEARTMKLSLLPNLPTPPQPRPHRRCHLPCGGLLGRRDVWSVWNPGARGPRVGRCGVLATALSGHLQPSPPVWTHPYYQSCHCQRTGKHTSVQLSSSWSSMEHC